ncbi:MAG: hypothetical protein PHI19_04030, partial [Clostridia bacterium]|nr:hypothetical protein [Clostridia bacterium]
MAKNIYKPGTPTYARKGMLKSSLIAVGVLAFITVILAAIILPNYTVEQPPVDKTVEAIVVQNEGLISIDADLSNVFVTVKYTDGTQSEFSLNEAVITGLDTSKEQTLDNVILDIGGFKQKVTFNVVSSAKIVTYEAGQGGVIEGDTVQRVFAGYDGTTVFAVPDEGYDFLRWSDGNPNAIRTDRQVSRDMTLTATFTKKRYIVVFYYPDGTTASEETVFHNEAATKVPLPSEPEMYKYGHILTGWSEEYAHITQDTNIYPVYQKYATDLYLSFTQSVEGVPLGTVKDLKSYYPKEEASILRVEANPFRRFVGWTIETYSGSKFIQPVMIEGDYASYPIGSLTNYVNFFSSRTASTDEYSLTFTPTAVTEEIYIKANFEYETSNITFSTMGSTLSSIELPAGQPIGEVFDVQPALYFDSATREAYLASDDCPEYLKVAGYVFKGWYIMGTSTNPSTGYPEFVTNETTFTRPTALIAYWEKNIYQVIFLQGDNQDDAFKNLEWYNPLTEQSETYYDDDLGGLVLTVLYQDQLGGALTGAFPEATPYKQYYTFSGWYVASTGGVATEELVDKTYKVTRSLAIVPVFRVIQKTAEFTVYGSGSVIKVQDGSETSVPGTYRMDAVQDYTFRFVAGEGYSLNNIEVFNGIGTVVLDASELRNPTTNTYEYSVVSPILQNYSFKVNFTTTEFDITINNGSAGVHGDIKHEDDADFSNSPEQYITVYSGQSKRIWINAPENYRIESIYTDGVLIDDLNSDATSYTLVLNDIAASIRVDINYAAIILEIFVPDNLQNGEINYESTESMMGSSPFISVEAYEGYYIKTLTVNGIKVDPYHPGPGMSVSQLISVASVAQEEQPQPDNASGSVTADNDIRVTYYVLTFDFITTSKSISVQYAPVFYHVNVTSDGVGAVNFNHQTVAEGSTIYVTASTSTTYYVHSYTYTNPSGDFEVHEIVLTNVLQDANIMLQNIERDVDVNVVFKRCKYTVDFSNKEGDTPGEFATLSFIDDEVPITKTLPYTLQMEALTSKQFTVQAIDGYEIESILVQTETQVRESIPGLVLGTREDIAFHAKSHTLTLDSVETGYSITVVCKIASYKVELWLANAKDTYTIDGMPVSYKQVVLNHAQTYIANIVFDSQSSFEPNNLIVTGTSDEVKVSMNSNTEITLEISNITGNAEIIVLFNPLLDSQQPHNIIAKADAATGSLVALREVDVDGVKVLTSIDNGQVVENETVVLKATPIDSGYILKYLIVNGNVVHAATDNTYRIEHVGSDIYAEAVFAANVIPLVIDRRNVFGMVSSPVTSFVYGDQIPVRIVAATGHLVSYVAIGSRSNQNILDDTTLALFNASGAERVTDYMIDSNNYTYEQLREGLYVSVEFAPIVFNLSIALSGSGNVGQDYEAGIDKQINYGTVVNIPITADDNNFISSISVNGISYNPFELRYATINAAIQKCINGVLELTITEDISIEIGFSPNVYKATVVPAWGGTTLVRTEGGIYSDGTDLQLLAGQNLEIYMLADKEQGTHISELYINGELIRPEYWKLDLYSPNNNRSITYEYKGPNGSGITGNVHIKVVYEINTYTVAVNLKNKSLNFRTVNVNPTSFGTVTLKGLSAVSSEAVYDTDSYLMTVQTYNGIPHGSPVYFSFNPVTYDGYKIDLDTAVITYYDSADTTSSEAKVIALKALISEKGDTYVLPALNFDIESVYVEFVKEKYTYSLENTYNRMGSTYFPEVSEPIGITFTNPYLPDNEVIVEKIDNKDHYEYGLDFVIACVPGEGYTVSSFLVNEEDRVNAMKGNNYTGRIVASLNVIAEYSITTHRVSFTTNLTEGQLDANIGSLSIYSDDNQLLWEPGMSLSEVTLPILTSSGSVVDFNSGYITVTYNTIVSFVATPNYEDYGFKVDYFTINNSFQTISNPDAENVIEHTVTALARGFVNFSIHYYNVAVNYFEGGTGTVNGSASVQWDSDSAVILNIFAGYKLTAILVNGTADAGLLASAKKTTLNDASNQYELEILQIKSDKILTIETERLAYDLTFDGGFMEAFEVLGLLQDSVTGAVFNEGREEEIAYFSKPSAWSGSNPLSASTIETDPKRYVYSGYRYKDSVTLYFMPIDGYKIKNINITMRTVRGVVNTIVNNTDPLIVYDNRYGHYYYRINEATGAINVSVNYEIKNYNVVMSTSGRGNISKVELNDDIQSGSTVTIPRTVNHYDQITIEFIADYGYHLENLIINDRVIEDVQYQKVERVIDGVNKVVYWYTTNTTGGAQTARMIIDSVVINGRNRFSVEAEFAINTYEVRTFINGTETDYDNALTLSLSNSKMEYNSNYTIFQNITEGYSITDITFKNYVDYVICSYDYAYPAHSAVLKSAQLVFLSTDVYIDHLDYHDDTGSNSMLFVYYNTIINTHTSIIDPYRYEYEKVGDDYLLVADPYGIPEVQKVTSGGTVNVPAYSLTRTYNNIEKGNDAIHNYNVDAKFRFFMEPAASDNYVFAGYQVYEDGIWRYINEDDTGFVLSSASVSPTGEAILDTLEYTIQSNRVFRAVVYRVYHVTVEIHPEYKWQSGTFSLTNFNMKYATYATLTARATFDSSMNPNLPDNSIVLADRDGTNDASYTYKVYSGAKLSLSLTDTKQAFYPVTGTQYYDITYNQNGHLVQTKRNYGTLNTVEIYSDRVVHAYANNDKMHLDVALETQGESVGAEGGSVKYYVYNESAGQFVSRSISNNALIMPTNTVVKLEITPKTSYRIDGVYQMETQNNPVDGYQVYIPDSWYKLATKLDNTLTITQMGDTMVVVMRLIENTVIKVKFWKQMEVTSSVNLLYGDTETVILNDEGPLGHLYFMQHSYNGIYDYEQDISYTVPNISELSRWDLRYQFIGYFVNGVNSFQQLDMNYPDSNSITYRLYNFDAIERPDGVTMVRNSTDEIYKVNIVAKYVLLLNITFENEYAFDTQGGTVYFDPGYYRTEYTHYDPGYPIYYTETDYINASVETHTDKTIQMYAKINDISTLNIDGLQPT